jgi:DDE domain
VQLKAEDALEEDCQHRAVQYLNNVLEQDHWAIKRRVRAIQHFRFFWGAWRTIAGYEAIHMIRKGQARKCTGWNGRSPAPLHSGFVRGDQLKLPIVYPDRRLGYKVATLPGKPFRNSL